MKFQKFGWNGIFFEVPEEMRFTRQGGDAKSGNLTLEAEDCLVEAKWEPIPKTHKTLTAIADALVEQMEKKAKKEKKGKKIPDEQSVKVVGKEDAHVSTHKALYMVLKSGIEERLYLWNCSESERLVIFRFVFRTFDEASKKIMKRIFDTLKCHAEGSNIWSVLNIRFETPKSFRLTEAKITVGRGGFTLADRKLATFVERTSRIVVEYFSMANLVYKETYKDLDKWLEENYLKDLSKKLRKRKIKFEDAEPRRLRRHKVIVKQAKSTSGLSWRSTALCNTAIWYCSGSNRICLVTVATEVTRPIPLKRELNEEDHAKIFDEILSSVKCH